MEEAVLSVEGLSGGGHLPSTLEHPGRAPGGTTKARVPLILVSFLPFCHVWREWRGRRMNGRSLLGGAGDASPLPFWRNPFGNKVGEAPGGGSSRLKLALARGPPPEQVGVLLQPLSPEPLGLSERRSLGNGVLMLLGCLDVHGAESRNSWGGTSHGSEAGRGSCWVWITMETLGRN